MAISTDRIVEVGSIERLAESFEVSLRARNLSDRTIETYLEALRLFTGYLHNAGMPTEVSSITREHVEAFLASELGRVSASSVSIRYDSLEGGSGTDQEHGGFGSDECDGSSCPDDGGGSGS